MKGYASKNAKINPLIYVVFVVLKLLFQFKLPCSVMPVYCFSFFENEMMKNMRYMLSIYGNRDVLNSINNFEPIFHLYLFSYHNFPRYGTINSKHSVIGIIIPEIG